MSEAKFSLDNLTPEQLKILLARLESDKLLAAEIPQQDEIEVVSTHRSEFPLSLAQQRLWLLAQMDDKANEAYVINGRLRLQGELDIGALQQALNQLVARHGVLRTRFASCSGHPVQRVDPSESEFNLAICALEKEQDIETLRFSPTFDLSTGPLVLGQLICVPDGLYELRLAMHHIISDGWSMGIFVEELSSLYEAFSRQQANPLLELPIQYGDYAYWQQRCLQGAKLKVQQSYWSAQLKGAPECLTLAMDHTRPKQQQYDGASIAVTLDADLTAQLRALSQRHACTLFMTLLAGWSTLMSRLASQEEVVIGTPVAGRTRTEIEPLIGMFVNTQALRVDLSTKPNTATLLAQVKATALAAQAHQDIPFEKVVEVVAPERSLSHSPIFQVMFALQNLPQSHFELSGLTLSAVTTEVTTAQFDLSLLMREVDGYLVGNLNYSTALFDEATVRRYLGYWKRLLQGMVTDSHQPVTAIPLLDGGEHHRLVSEFNQTNRWVDQAACVHSLIEQQAVNQPDAVAVVSGGHSLTYGELNAQANQLAHYLRAQGVAPDSLVALCLDRGVALIVAMLAVLKAGGAYIPMDPAYPSERLQYIVQDSEPKVLIKDNSVALETFGEVIGNLTVIDSQHDGAHWSSLSTDNPQQRALTSQHLAYVVYTSGSTGKPKGVMVEHRNLMNLVHWHNRTFDVTTGTCSSAVAGLGFDASVWEIWPPLCAGAYLTLPSLAISKDPEALLAWWVAQPIEVGFLSTPLAELAFAKALNHPTLRTLLVGGDRLHRRPPKNATYQLINNYGPTETTVVATSGEISADSEVLHIGGPIDNTQIYILGEDQTLLPEGVKGEVYIGGLGVARGYLNRPELNESSFILDPFSSQPTARLYRTGDLARWGADGRLEYLGRNDDQVKIRGFRIELGEIEAALQASEWVEEAIVLALNTSAEHEDKRLVAYYTAKADEHVSIEDIRSHLAAHLPSYMVPAAYVQLDKLPLTANGKVDRKALPEPDESAFSRREYQAPEGELEQVLANIWQDLLKVEKVGRHDNFFELGGHSLKAVQLIEQLRQQSYHLSIKHLFNQPTLAALASSMGAAEEALESFDVPPNLIPQGCERITPEMLPLVNLSQDDIVKIEGEIPKGSLNIQDIYPLAPLQEGMLFHHLSKREGDVYVARFIQGFKSLADLHLFMDALRTVIKRHDILRTSILWDELTQPVQVVWREVDLPLNKITIDGDDVLSGLQQHFSPTHTRLNIQSAPMIEAHYAVDVQHDRWLLCLLFHHLCIDHTTLELLSEEIQAHLAQKVNQLPKPSPFRNFIAQVQGKADLVSQQTYFQTLLGDIDEASAPFGVLDTNGMDDHAIETVHLPVAAPFLAMRIRERARLHGVSAASLFHLAWGRVVSATTGREDVVFGTVLFGRMDAGSGADRILGMFLNTLPLRLSLANLSVEEALQQTHGLLAQLLDYEHTSLALVQRCSGLPSKVPLFSSLLNYRYQGGHSLLSEGEESTALSMDVEVLFSEESTNYPLSVSVNDMSDGQFSLNVHADKRIGCERVGQMLLKALEQLVEALEQKPASLVQNLSVLSEDERYRVVVAVNDTQALFPSNQYIHTLFEQQAWLQPDAIAVVCDKGSLSYGELNRLANQLAHWLVEQGVRPDSRVAVSLERNCDLIVSLMAILKAGGAYVPLDPGYPEDRLEYMLNDSQPVVLITTSRLQSQLGQIPSTCRVMDMAAEHAWLNYPTDNLEPQTLGLTNRHLAYVIYTSGSTGKPKGVMNEHRGVVNRLHWMIEDYGFTPEDVLLQKTPFSFDVSVWEFFCPLYAGAKLVMAAPGGHKDPVYLRNLIEQQRITVLHFVPPMLQTFLETLSVGDCPSLRYIFCSGEALLAETVRNTYARLPRIALHNLYGPTEAAVEVTAWACPVDLVGDRMSIGAPVANTQMYVLDAQGQPVPEGVSGELYIGGIQVARGYLNQPELSAERFLADPFSTDPEARLYRTGDLGRWLGDGTLEYLGRNDDQVKIRGFRIELDEISSMLQSCRGIQDAIVVAHGAIDKSLVAYYTQGVDVVISQADLKAELSERLPEHMVPHAYVLLATLPLMPNGKVNRKALPEPDSRALIRRAYEAPQGQVEQALAAIWQDLLKLDKVSRHDSFFELGGHSLMSVQLMNLARKVGLDFDLSTLFAYPQLRSLASRIGQAIAEPESGIVIFRETDSQPPLFIVPESSGELLYVPQLTSAIDEDIPVYGLVAPDRNQPSSKTIQKIAAHYVKTIRQVQPNGPYRLLGWSIAGKIAFEMAAQLFGQDQSIEFLGMLDTWAEPPEFDEVDNKSIAATTFESEDEKIVWVIRAALNQQLEEAEVRAKVTPEEISSLLTNSTDWRDYFLLAKKMDFVPARFTEHYFYQWFCHREDILSAQYRFQTLPLQLDLFVAENSKYKLDYLGWDKILPVESIQVTSVEGSHLELVSEPYIGGVGRSISAALNARALSNASNQLQRNDYNPVVKLQMGSPLKPTLLCIPGAGDNVFAFMGLLQCFPADWTVIGLQPRGLTGEDVPHSSVEAAAAFYYQVLQDHLQQGDLHILGHSFGGWVGLSLAQQLEAAGMRVASLTLADSRSPRKDYQEFTDVHALMKLINLFEMKGYQLGISEKNMSDLTMEERLERLHYSLIEHGVVPKSMLISDLMSVYRVFSTNIRTTFNPDSSPNTRISLILAKDSPSEQESEWKHLCPEMLVSYSNANHMTLLTPPFVSDIASIIMRV